LVIHSLGRVKTRLPPWSTNDRIGFTIIGFHIGLYTYIGFGWLLSILPAIGFLGIGASLRARTKRTASSTLPSANFSGHHRFPALHKCVHGGWAIMRSHPSDRWSRTLPWICGPGCSEGNRSRLTAS
jgi:hypothetical protein